MKVNIRYTVDLEEVLDEMSALYHKSSSKLEHGLEIYNFLLSGDFKEIDLERTIIALEHNLDCYVDHQTKIAEILNILKGYKGIKDGELQPATSQDQDGEDK